MQFTNMSYLCIITNNDTWHDMTTQLTHTKEKKIEKLYVQEVQLVAVTENSA